MSPDRFLDTYRRAKASAILRTSAAESVAPAMEAAVQGGFRVIEFTLTTPGALDWIREFSRREGLVVGAGTVLDASQAEDAVRAGASFLVSPVMDEDVIAAAKSLQVTVMPGCSTPTEMLRAHRAGAALQKLFPAPGTGPAWVKQTLGPLPFLRIVPTSGVTRENAALYLEAGAFAVGFVNTLFEPADVIGGAFQRIEARAREMLQSIEG